MRGIAVPERTEDFTADPVELFFDLAFVYAFSQLVGHLVHEPDWAGVGQAALLFMLLWLPWSQFTWSANAVSGNGRRVRILFLAATAVSVPMAASVSTAFDDGGPVFAICLGTITLIGMATMGLGTEMEASERASLAQWVSINTVSLTLLVVGSFLDTGPRTVAWIGTVIVIFVAMGMAGGGDWVIRPGHFAERHGLIIIIALGEVIVAIGIPVVATLEAGAGLTRLTVVALGAAGVFAGLLWWGYFDRPGPALEHHAGTLSGRDLSRYVRDTYTWFHAPIVAGIILSAAALEEITLHPDHELPLNFRVMLVGGLALTIFGIAAGVWRAFRAIAKERLVAGIVIAALAAAAGSIDGVELLVLVDAVIFATLIIEHRRIEG